ncbi:glycoside hydrolase [Podospora australis]|uniref:lytic cellulose monooxygenase (C4-dehydrogenating) n=1 Tax=Podospora australis TaxID=1536484 RepID=A0AAN7ABB0_9PEZI|nr:glycoside hydrolase [Podospora australis]
MKLSPLLLLAAVSQVHGHGGIFNYTIDGIDYAGHFPWLPESTQQTIQRRWWGDPIRSVSHSFLSCNRGIPLASSTPTLHAPVKPGSTITARFHHPECPLDLVYPTKPSVPGDEDPPLPLCMGPTEGFWFHTTGPLVVYLASCGERSCHEVDSAKAKWFKIDESGLEEGYDVFDVNGWKQFQFANEGWNVTLPKNLKRGNYLMRHEIIYIENDPAQFYPYCAQIQVEGDGEGFPEEKYFVEFPGGYSAQDPGIAVSGLMWSQDRDISLPTNYTIPGPPVWTGKE